ncbi:MAG: hypothetical protein GY863_13905, partial [bacterium]|nr:hypothetical protein [bacterium]
GIVLPHDDRIYESDNFLTFSDASSDAVKREYSKMAEESLAEIMTAFGFEGTSELGITGRETKITIFSNRFLDQNQEAFSYGFILYSLDSPQYYARSEERKQRYRNVVKHETRHIFDFLYFGLNGNSAIALLPVWFIEGSAEYISEGGSIPIETTEELDFLILDMQSYSHPLDIISYDDLLAIQSFVRFYPVFNLAVRYLLDEEGLGRSYQDIISMYDDIIINHDFNSAFEQHMGISVEYYRENFFDLARGLFQ